MKIPHNENVLWPDGPGALQEYSCTSFPEHFPAALPDTPDQDLFRSVSVGDQPAFEQLFWRYYSPLCRFSKQILGNSIQAEDIVQDVFEKIWNRREDLVIQTSVKAYLYMMVKNYSLNHLKWRRRMVGIDTGDVENNILFATNNAEAALDAASLHNKLSEVIETLPPKCRRVFKMSRIEHKSYKEIAGSLDLSVKTVENHIGKALQVLKCKVGVYDLV